MLRALISTFCLLFPLYCIYKPPQSLIRYVQHRWPDVLFHHPTTKKIVALTIDDAPSTQTNVIIDILKSHNATATFFVIGSQVPGYTSVLTKMVRDGHELANHAMYDQPSRALSDAVLAEQIQTVHGMIQDAYREAGQASPANWFFRPGSGFFTSRMRALVSNMGYRLVLGDVYPHDPQVPFVQLNARHILSMVRPGSIIVCHDRREWTAPMLLLVLPELHRRGYEIGTISQLLQTPGRESG